MSGRLEPLPYSKIRHRIWKMAWPIVVSNVSVPLLGAVDTAVVGHLPDPSYIGAVALGAVYEYRNIFS